MLNAILPLLANGSIALVFKAEANDQVRVSFTQKPTESNKVPIPAFSILSKAEAVEAEISAALVELGTHRAGTVETVLKEAKATMDAEAAREKAEADSKRKNAKTTRSGSTVKSAGNKPAPNFDDDDDESHSSTQGADATSSPAAPSDSTNTPAQESTPALFD